jgi:mono/diheme cytochrome c family protein
MKYKMFPLAAFLLAFAGGQAQARDEKPRPAAPGNEDPALVKRGEYLVNQVAHCGECHTPRDARGRLDGGRHLQGARMWFTPKVKAGEFEDHAPDLTSSGKGGKWDEARMVRLLTGGKKADPPMPVYRFTPEDARAAAAYLRSLPGKKEGDRKEKEGERRGKGKKRERDDD